MNNRGYFHPRDIRPAVRRCFTIALIMSVVCPRAFAVEVKEPITVHGDKVEYFQEKKMVLASDNIVITYGDVTMTCDKITVYLDTKEAIAEGNVKITQKGAYFTGDKINYNFEKRTAQVINGYVNAKPFYGKAKKMGKASDTQFMLENGYATTCELEKPHYRIQAEEVKIYLDDKVVARNIFFYVGKIPLLYLPYYIQPLKERSAHFTVLAGKEKNWGYYALSSLRYYFSEICKGRFRLDYRTKKGLAEGVDNYFTTKTLGNGSAKFYFAHENDAAAYSPSGEVKSRWRTQVRHRWDITDDTVSIFEFNQLSDPDVIKDYFYKEFEEEGAPDTYLSVTTTKSDYTANFLVRKRVDRFFTVVERLPEFKIDIRNYRIGTSPIYYKAEASGTFLNQTFAKNIQDQKDIGVARVDTYNQLAYASKVLGFLSATPYAGTRQTFYSRTRWGDTNLIRGIFQTGVDMSTKFYRIYDVESKPYGIEIHGLRHIITPTANYYYTYKPTIVPDNLYQFDEIDAFDKANGVKLALENKLQTKRPRGIDGASESVDLATLIVSSDYMFRLKKNNASFKSQKFKTVDLQLELNPYPWMFALWKSTINTKDALIESSSVDITASGGDAWSLGFGHRYEFVRSEKSSLITYDASYRISPKWKVRGYGRFEIDKGKVQEQEYTIYRDLHCWLVELTYNIKEGMRNQSIFFVMRLKAFPEVPIGFRQSYNRPQPGRLSEGGS